ncbi:histidine phosphatase family protein [Lactobacillus psittaci]|uniref:Alpha-ribazole phosphatase n=1 Tax=Lactobacillus psittaci DSM 15354 TaxID=1122152 RepID=A0A0R1S2L5_9LACO|nr:histidine phosphatase family protein [Lactobacillus psittaci]KRL63373.1 alpha-ribazole phosphatase [Lactobacillus psittaci DSM 15354]
MKKIYIVRHGRTYINHYNKMQGWCDTPLTEAGEKGAQEAAEALKNVPFDIAFSSDTKRANDTCDIIVQRNINHNSLQHLTSKFFREQFYGYFEGMDSDMAWRMIAGPVGLKNLPDLLENYSIDEIKDLMHKADPYHEAESAAQYWNRIEQGLDLIRELDGYENILLVTHGFTIRSLVAKYGQGKFDIKTGPRNSSITIMEMTDRTTKITSYNQLEV